MTRAHYQSLLENNLRRVYFDEYDLIDQQFNEIYNVEGADKAVMTDAVVGGLSQFELQNEGGPFNVDNAQEAWTKTYTILEYTKAIVATRIAMEDELYGILPKFKRLAKNLANAAGYTREVLAAVPFNNLSDTLYTAESTAYTMLSLTHFRIDGGTWANRPNTFGDLSLETLETALRLWRTGMVDQRGQKIMVQPELLVVGPADEMLGARLLESDRRPGGNDNDPNVVRTRRNLKLKVWDFMTDDTRWFLLAPKAKTGLNWFNKRAVTFERFDISENGNMEMVGSFRSAVGATHATGIFGSS